MYINAFTRRAGIDTATALLALIFAAALQPAAAQVGNPERDVYISSVPLSYPQLVRQAHPSAAFHLYGDTASPTYRDTNPVDGMDDRRHALLQDLAVRFAPYMVLNTTVLPMDFKKFAEQGAAFPMQVDTWDVGGHGELIQSEFIDLNKLDDPPCALVETAAGTVKQPTTSDDCRLLELLEDLDPEQPQNPRASTLAYDFTRKHFKVMFIDYPGYSEETWQEEYANTFTNQLQAHYHTYPKVDAHPFIHEVRSNLDGTLGYEFVVQFWLFYPFNDGGNNHEGDWEHINVVIAPKNQVTEPQSAETIERILAGGFADGSDEELVIKRVEYYFHHYVIQLDYSVPNVYAPEAEWEAQKASIIKEEQGIEWVWDKVRHRAYWDDAEQVPNTHPVIYIGADNKGWDQILAAPGGKSRNPNGSYPFPGLYRSIGPAGASEKITVYFDHRAYYDTYLEPGIEPPMELKHGSVYAYDDPSKIRVLPDWERVHLLVRTSAEARQAWWWMTLPVYYGYPRADSPFSGIVANVDMGNLAVRGPQYNSGWNQSGATASYDVFNPHRFPSVFPLGFQDNIKNSLGWINVPLSVLALPPFDFILGLLKSPVRAIKGTDPVFYATDNLPYRTVSLGGGVSFQRIPDAFRDLLVNQEQYPEILESIDRHVESLGGDSTTETTTSVIDFETNAGWMATAFFTLGNRLITENIVRHRLTPATMVLSLTDNVPDYHLTSKLNLWEYAGSVRYNFSTSSFQPYGKLGYGFSWYRMEDTRAEGQLLPTPDSQWYSWKWMWSGGLGAEFFIFRSRANLPKGIDLSLKGEVGWYNHDLGVRTENLPLNDLLRIGTSPEDLPREQRVTRTDVSLAIVLSF